jgi:hypothetical protein
MGRAFVLPSSRQRPLPLASRPLHLPASSRRKPGSSDFQGAGPKTLGSGFRRSDGGWVSEPRDDA